ncbi:unnamed protein product [Albugo candida]|uniref:t-SNARE coiled-coil homology domain-containing protein n=1 Tax=Albugo candida TaxID=65357 RepID=A0A024G2H0_9STRA|nr:unnamed protein product [Albugo candida]|eukprot:CCI40503.1 unnamed protein product [Albugo candida]
MAARDIDGLLEKLTKINAEMGGDESKKKKGKGTSDRFEELKTKIGERLHRLKANLQESEPQIRRNKHPREVIRRQQEIREDIRTVTEDIHELKMSHDQEAKKKKSKFTPLELSMRKEYIEQYTAELVTIRDMAAQTYARSNAMAVGYGEDGIPSAIGTFENGAFFAKHQTAAEYVLSGGGDGKEVAGVTRRAEEVTGEQEATLQQIKNNDQRFDQIIDQIGTGVQELGQLARGLNEELQQQSIMIDGLDERIDTTQAHVESVNQKMKKTLETLARSPDKCMMDMICLILLLGILTVVYNMFIKK